MAHWNFHRNVMSVRLLSELAIELGTTADFLLSGSGLSKDQLAESELLISAQQELQVIRNLVSTSSQKPALGIIAGTRYHFTVFGALGFAIVSSRTMRSALDVALQHFHLTFAFTRFVVSECDSGINVQLIDNDIPAELAQFIIERDVAALITVARDLYDLQPMVTRVTFKCAPPADISNYCSFFNVEPEFSASENCVEFDRTMFDRPLPRANELAHAAAVDQCRLLLESRRGCSACQGQNGVYGRVYAQDG